MYLEVQLVCVLPPLAQIANYLVRPLEYVNSFIKLRNDF